jgi:hypothetical protein
MLSVKKQTELYAVLADEVMDMRIKLWRKNQNLDIDAELAYMGNRILSRMDIILNRKRNKPSTK